jgi:plasmid stabilization system protein ParE
VIRPVKVKWRRRALADLRRIDAWLSGIEGAHPAKVRARIGAAVASLARLGDIGRPSKVAGWRELSVRKAPYVIAYRVRGEFVEILAVYHTAQDRNGGDADI